MPLRFLRTLQWFAQRPESLCTVEQSPGARFQAIESESELPPVNPATVDRALPWQLRDIVAATCPPEGLWEFESLRYFHSPDGALIDRNNRLIREFVRCPWGPEHHDALVRIGLPRPTALEGTTAVLTTLNADNNYHHWLHDLGSRVALLAKAGVQPDRYLINHGSRRWQLQCLEAWGIPLDRVFVPSKNQHLQLERAIVPTWGRKYPLLSPWAIDWIAAQGPAPAQTGRRLYCPRTGESIRRLSNEDEVIRALKPLGFEVVDPGRLSIQDQWRTFAEAEVVVAPHGAALANIAFCRPGATVVEIMSPRFATPLFGRLAAIRGLRYGVVLGDRPFPPEGNDPNERTVDFGVKSENVLALVRQMLEVS